MKRASSLRLLRARRRGFTLVELLVATLAGLTVSLGAFAFARAATRSFQQELRISDATSNATIGFRRLVADIERAGYLSPANVQREFSVGNRVCMQPNNAFSKAIQSLSALRVEQGPTATTGSIANISSHPTSASKVIDLAPDRLTLSGSYASSEQFPVKAVSVTGNTTDIYLEPLSGAAMRTINGGPTTPWTRIFQQGRILRVVDPEGYQHFGHIQGVTIQGDTPRISLSNKTPAFYMRGSAPGVAINPLCKGFTTGRGSLANVINRVRYEVRDLKAVAAYADLYANPTLPEDDQRWELVRYELDENDNLVAGTEELVAEFAVDLKFAMTAMTAIGSADAPNPTLGFFDFGAGDIGTKYGAEVSPGSVQAVPERTRSVRVRFSVRSREPDRSSGLDPALMNASENTLFRYKIPNSTRFARVRTLQAEVSMANQSGVFYP